MVYRSKRYYYIKTERKIGRLCEGVSSDFCAKSLQKRLKVLFMVSVLCDTVFTGEAPGTKQTHRRETP